MPLQTKFQSTASIQYNPVMDQTIPPDVEDLEDDFAMKLKNYVKRIVTLPDVTDGSLQPDSVASDTWQECCICHDPYEYKAWQLGQTVHRPIQLTCGHVFGLPCLARWASEVEFSNHCPFCRSSVYGHPPVVLSNFAAWRLTKAIMQIQVICLNHPYYVWCTGKDTFSRALRPILFNSLLRTGSEMSTERTMAFFEAMLDVWWDRTEMDETPEDV